MKIQSLAAAIAAALLLAACSAQPQQTLTQLNTSDPKFNSPECLDIRGRALVYDDKVGERMAVGLVSGLLLGPFGIPIAAAADAQQEEHRKVFNREITLRCMTGGEQIVAEQDAKDRQMMQQALTAQNY